MTSKKLAFVTVEPKDGKFTASLSIEGLWAIERDPELLLQEAAELYGHSVAIMNSLIAEMQAYRAQRKPIPARMMWKLGDAIFRLKYRLEALYLQLDDAYSHLVRDLGVKRKWLEKAVIFRRHLPKEELIPKFLNWGRCEKGTRKSAEQLRKGLPLD